MHGGRLAERYGLEEYTDTTKPALFYGMFFSSDWNAVLQHTGKRAVLWSGSDALGMARVKLLCSQPDILHIVSSKWVEADIKKFTNNYVVIPRINSNIDFWTPEPLGSKIYWCNSTEPKYGSQHLGALLREFGESMFIFTNSHGDFSNTTYSMERMRGIYNQCFIGLRLTERDGCPQTVMELGLMGRPVVWNGDSPNALHYRNTEDIIDVIHSAIETNKVADRQSNELMVRAVSERMREYLSTNLLEVIEKRLKII